MNAKKWRSILFGIATAIQLPGGVREFPDNVKWWWEAITSLFAGSEWIGYTVLAATVGFAIWDQMFDFKGLPRFPTRTEVRLADVVLDDVEVAVARDKDRWMTTRETERWLKFRSQIVRNLASQTIRSLDQRHLINRRAVLTRIKGEIAQRLMSEFEQAQPEAVVDNRFRRIAFYRWLEERE
ncbi:hypothetical protein [Candidatus Palauibacter sp.]|uniref:hypothetical protein n=1 Tax=Candidatus Palauibacter sp. TaxID=3101350 RepID=UPI003B02A2F6